MKAMRSREPIFNVPPSVLGVLALLVGVHVVRALLPDGESNWLTLALAFIPARYAGAAADLPGGETAAVTSFATHMLVHGDLTHLLINSAWLLAFGGAVANRAGGLRFLLLSLVTGIAGAALFLALNWGLEAPMVGASGAVSGLMGATMRFLFSAIDRGGLWRLRDAPETVRRMTLMETLRDSRAVTAIVVWLGLNALTTFGVGALGWEGGIAWEAHVGGFLVGLTAFALFDRVNPQGNSDGRWPQ